MFLRVILASLAIGYNWSYNLGVFIGYLTGKICKYEGLSGFKPCCGNKTESQCYCRLTIITIETHKLVTRLVHLIEFYLSKRYWLGASRGICNYLDKFSCSKDSQHSNSKGCLNYNPNAPNAILLLHKVDDLSKVSCCSTECTNPCESTKCKCLKLLGIYKIDSVTTNNCENCQLTVRLEGTCCDSKQYPSSCGNNCSLSEKCCLCLNCCKKNCECECKCCIHICNGTSSCKCNCNQNSGQGVRVFIGFKNCNGKCCIREIRPNLSKEFTADLTVQNQFDIKSIVISDCCHNDLTVDIQCSMKNNFFRVSSINYPKKTIQPLLLTLMRNGTECCKAEVPPKCCCKNTDLVNVCVIYDGSEPKCEVKCECKGEKPCCCDTEECCCRTPDGKCCCCITCQLNVDQLSSFYLKFESLKVPFASISIYFIVLLTIFFVCIVSYIRESTIPPYIFSFKTNLKSLNEVVNSRGLNTDDLICKRITYALTSKDTIYVQTRDTERLLNLFSDVLGNNSCQQLRKQVASQSNRFIASSIVDDMKKKIEMVRWCYATGFVYAYFTILFKSIQKFFAYWEEAWISEFKDYKTFVYPIVSKISHKAKFSLSSFSESDVVENGIFNYNGSRSTSWSDVLVELDMFSDLYIEESQVFSHSLPYRLDLRFERYLERWEHRLNHVRDWIDSERSVYDWNPFMSGLRIYKSWFEDFQRYLTLFSYNVTLPSKELQKHTQIFLPRQIK